MNQEGIFISYQMAEAIELIERYDLNNPEDVVKVDLKKSKLDKVVVKFEYQIRITNEGKIGGWCDEIKDHIPDGLTFDQIEDVLGIDEETAKKMFERHTIISKFLMSLGVDEETATEDACRIEHVISDESFNAIKKKVNL